LAAINCPIFIIAPLCDRYIFVYNTADACSPQQRVALAITQEFCAPCTFLHNARERRRRRADLLVETRARIHECIALRFASQISGVPGILIDACTYAVASNRLIGSNATQLQRVRHAPKQITEGSRTTHI
jgi:hypothetical protein